MLYFSKEYIFVKIGQEIHLFQNIVPHPLKLCLNPNFHFIQLEVIFISIFLTHLRLQNTQPSLEAYKI